MWAKASRQALVGQVLLGKVLGHALQALVERRARRG
jgi:hypothetical protein